LHTRSDITGSQKKEESACIISLWKNITFESTSLLAALRRIIVWQNFESPSVSGKELERLGFISMLFYVLEHNISNLHPLAASILVRAYTDPEVTFPSTQNALILFTTLQKMRHLSQLNLTTKNHFLLLESRWIYYIVVENKKTLILSRSAVMESIYSSLALDINVGKNGSSILCVLESLSEFIGTLLPEELDKLFTLFHALLLALLERVHNEETAKQIFDVLSFVTKLIYKSIPNTTVPSIVKFQELRLQIVTHPKEHWKERLYTLVFGY
jgi:hypothetical protein